MFKNAIVAASSVVAATITLELFIPTVNMPPEMKKLLLITFYATLSYCGLIVATIVRKRATMLKNAVVVASSIVVAAVIFELFFPTVPISPEFQMAALVAFYSTTVCYGLVISMMTIINFYKSSTAPVPVRTYTPVNRMVTRSMTKQFINKN